MTCWKPIKAYRSRERTSSGGYGITFNSVSALVEGSSFELPCGRCIGCRFDRSQQWAMRCMHEAQLYRYNNSWITLTYSDEHVPVSYSVDVRPFQLFMKRLRKSLPQKIRFFACGEYGDEGLRPHFHACIFNHNFPDKTYYTTRRGNIFYKSKSLDELWPFGQINEIADLTYDNAAYTARYVMKKINGDKADDHYWRVSPVDQQPYRVQPEFCVMSRRPGLGQGWFDKFKTDAFPSDYIIVNGRKQKPPRFYLQQLTEDQPNRRLSEHGEQTNIKRARKRHALKNRHNNTKERLAVREEVQTLRANRLKREL